MLTWFQICNEICDAIWWRSYQISSPGVDRSPLGRLACTVWRKKDVCSPWAGTTAAGALVGDTTRGMACLMLKCHTVCARPTILISNIVKRLGMYVLPACNVLSECLCAQLPAPFALVCFLTIILIHGRFHGLFLDLLCGSQDRITHW